MPLHPNCGALRLGALIVGLGLLPLTAGADEPKAPATPKLEIVQSLKGGEDGLPKPFVTAYTIVVKGSHVYLGGNNISCFQRDLQTGKLTFAGEVADVIGRVDDAFPATRKWGKNGRKTCIIKLAGNRLYAIPQCGTGMAWYDIDDRTGKLTEKGVVECPPCFHAVVSPDQKDIYLMTNPYAKNNVKMAVAWYHLDAEGKPVQAGQVTGKGIGGTDQSPYEGILQITPDGKYLYSIAGDDHAVACMERKANGEITYKSATDLEMVAPRPKSGKYPWVSTLISPDGQWLYAGVWAYGKPVDNCFGIFKRNPDSGELTFQEAVGGDQNVLANRRGWQNTRFLPDGSGLLGHYDLGLWAFQYDAQTGRLSHPTEVKESQRYKANVAYDLENGFLYMGGVWIVEGGIQDGFRVLKLETKK